MSAKRRILIADDSEMNREILKDMLQDEYDILVAENGEEAIFAIQRYGAEIDLLLLDIVMPKMDGFEVLAHMNKYKWTEDIPVIMISAENSPSAVHKAYEMGVSDYISRPFDETIVHKRVSNTIMLYAKQKRLVNAVTDQIFENEKSSSLMIAILSNIVEFRNGESGLHVLHVRILTKILLQHLLNKTKKYPLSRKDITLISMASALHDIGKISIPDEILNKPGRFTEEEFAIMKNHSAIGGDILKALPFPEEKLIKYAYEICRWHHERYDGRGYPDGLVGEEIPIAAQVVSIADVYDALTSERVYKKAFSHEDAMRMITNGECGSFNPILIDCLKETAEIYRYEINNTVSNSLSNKEDVRNIVYELTQNADLGTSERTLESLEHQLTKEEFFMGLTQDILFEYVYDTDILTLSPYGAKQLKLSENTLHPFADGKQFQLIKESDFEEIKRIISETDVKSPGVTYCCTTVDGKKLSLKLRTIWALGEEDKIVGVIGKVTL